MNCKFYAAFLAIAFISCSKADFKPVEDLKEFTVSISTEELKTAILPSDSSKYLAVWQSDDKFQIYIDQLSAAAGKKYVLTNNVSGRSATFLGNVGSNEGSHTIYGFYPAEALVSGSDSYDGDYVLSVDLPSRQNPTLTSFDPLCDILASEPLDVTFTQSHAAIVSNARFSRKTAIVKLVPKDVTAGKILANDQITAVKISAGADKVLTGRAQLNISSAEIEKWTSQSAKNNVSAFYSRGSGFNIDGKNAAFMMVAPGTLNPGDTLNFELCTDRHFISKSVVLASNIVMEAGRVAVINVSFNDSCVSECGDELPLQEDFSSIKDGNNTSTSGSSYPWSGNENFPDVSNVFKAGGAVRVGRSSDVGSIVSKALNLSTPFTVSFKVKGWTSSGSVVVSCGSQSKTVSYTNTMSGQWESASVSFFGESSVAKVKFSTTEESKRCFIDDVTISSGKEDEHEILVSSEQITLACTSGSISSFSVIADCDWTASSTAGSYGFNFSPAAGTHAEYVTVNITSTQANTGTTSRLLGGIRITDGVATKIVSVFQAAPSDPSVIGWAELPSVTTGTKLETCHHAKLPSNNGKRNYSYLFDKDKHCALWVAWPLHSCYIGSASRTDNFDYDPVFIDNVYEAQLNGAYYPQGGGSSSHSRGHQLPSAERTKSTADNTTTFYSTNMTPQISGFNSGVWETLEAKERTTYICSDTLYIVTGPYFDPSATPQYAWDNKGIGKMCRVPTHYWKVFLRTKSGNSGKNVKDCTASELKCVGFWFEHATRSGSLKSSDLRSVSQIEALTGFTFFPNVPNAPKSTYTASDWGL